jgi:hypothetical protein
MYKALKGLDLYDFQSLGFIHNNVPFKVRKKDVKPQGIVHDGTLIPYGNIDIVEENGAHFNL